MADGSSDPYVTLGVRPGASDAEVLAAYRRAVKLHHPDHNRGSAESALRFEAVQDAYARIRIRRASAGASAGTQDRLAELEHELRAERERAQQAARQERERARRAAREATSGAAAHRPSDEELGYIKTDDSFSKIFTDAASELSERLADALERHRS